MARTVLRQACKDPIAKLNSPLYDKKNRLVVTSRKVKSVGQSGRNSYLYLANFAGAYLMQQDYDIYGSDPKEVLASYMHRESAAVSACLKVDMQRFLEDSRDLADDALAHRYNTLFYPGEVLEGRCGRTTRQWLREFCDILSRPDSQSERPTR